MSSTFEELCNAAYKKERAISRRMTRKSTLSEEQALRQTLEKAAGDRSLDDLLKERLQAQLEAADRVAARKQKQAEALAQRRAKKQPDPCAWLAWFDGATRPNPGKMGVGGLLRSPNGKVVEICFAAGQGDSNEAEYMALIAVLKEAVRHQPEKLVVYGDSQVVINAMRNTDNDGAPHILPYCEHAKRLVSQLNAVTLTWIPRVKNNIADALSQRALQSPQQTELADLYF